MGQLKSLELQDKNHGSREKNMLVNIYTIIFQLINIAILYYFLKKLLYKPVGNFLEKRREDIKAQFAEAKKQRQEAKKLYAEYNARLKSSREEVEGIISQAKKEAELLRNELLEKARQEAASLLEGARQDIERQKNRMLSEVTEKVADLSVMISSKIIEERLSPEEHHRLIQQAMERMDESRWVQ